MCGKTALSRSIWSANSTSITTIIASVDSMEKETDLRPGYGLQRGSTSSSRNHSKHGPSMAP